LLGLPVVAQSIVSGSIKDANTGEPLFGANVLLLGTGRGTISDKNGVFEMQNVPDGSYELKISYLGYSSHHSDIQAPTNNLEIGLKPISLLTEEFIVSATRAGETTPTTFHSISKETLSKNNFGQDLPFLLNNTPSVITHSDAGAGIGYTGMRIRGTD